MFELQNYYFALRACGVFFSSVKIYSLEFLNITYLATHYLFLYISTFFHNIIVDKNKKKFLRNNSDDSKPKNVFH